MGKVIELCAVQERWNITVSASASEEFVEYISPRANKGPGILISAKSIDTVPALIEQGKKLLARGRGGKSLQAVVSVGT